MAYFLTGSSDNPNLKNIFNYFNSIVFKTRFFWANTSMPLVNSLSFLYTSYRPRFRWHLVSSANILFSGFGLTFVAPFSRLLETHDGVFINARLVTSNNAFDECRTRLANTFFRPLFGFLLQKNQGFRCESDGDALHTQNVKQNVSS